jgi:tetratricopeptide (TPR) repeat protein
MRTHARAIFPGRLKFRGWIALCLIAMVMVSLPLVLSSRFVSQRRAALKFKRAQAHLASREFDQARTEFRAALRLQPGNAEARHQLAAMELGVGNWEVAFLEFQSLSELHPEDPNGWIGLSDLMMKSGLLETPEAALDRAIEVAPRRADAHRLRGDVRFRLGRYHGAHLDAEAAVAEAPKDVASWVLLVRSAARSLGTDAGIEAVSRGLAAVGKEPALLLSFAYLLAERDRTREAIKTLEEIVSDRTDSETAWSAGVALARVEVRAGDRDAARRRLDAVLLQRPVDEEALALRAVMDASGGRVDASLAQLDAALELLPMSRTLRDVYGRLQSARNDPAAIAALLAEIMASDLGPAPAPSSRVRAEAGTGRAKLALSTREHWPGRLAQMRQALEVQLLQRNWTEAQRIIESARRTFPDTAFAPFLGGILGLARGDVDGAEKNLSEALAAAPRSSVVTAALAKAWSRRKDAAFAAEQLMHLADRDAEFALARSMAARAYLDARDPIRAEAALRRGLESQPGSTVPYQQLADYYLGLERTAEALSICQEGLARFPQDVGLQLMLAQISAGFGNAKEAIRIYQDVLSRKPDLDLVAYKVATLFGSQDDDERSRQRSNEIVRQLQTDLPSDPLLLDVLGWVQYGAHHTRRARQLLESAVKGAPDEPSLRFHLAMVYARENKNELARDELKAALDSHRPFAERLDALRLLRESGPASAAEADASVAPDRR